MTVTTFIATIDTSGMTEEDFARWQPAPNEVGRDDREGTEEWAIAAADRAGAEHAIARCLAAFPSARCIDLRPLEAR